MLCRKHIVHWTRTDIKFEFILSNYTANKQLYLYFPEMLGTQHYIGYFVYVNYAKYLTND